MTTREYNTCVDEHSDAVYRFLIKHYGDREPATDGVQNAFVKLWEHVQEITVEKAKSYLFSVAYNDFIDKHRRNKVHSSYVGKQESPASFQSEYIDTMDVLKNALDRLPADQKTVLMLRDYEGYSYEEIANITQLNESQVKVYIFRARLALKKYVVRIENII